MTIPAGWLLWWPERELIPSGWVKDDRALQPGQILIRKIEGRP